MPLESIGRFRIGVSEKYLHMVMQKSPCDKLVGLSTRKEAAEKKINVVVKRPI